jgi:hypothetical protein
VVLKIKKKKWKKKWKKKRRAQNYSKGKGQAHHKERTRWKTVLPRTVISAGGNCPEPFAGRRAITYFVKSAPMPIFRFTPIAQLATSCWILNDLEHFR